MNTKVKTIQRTSHLISTDEFPDVNFEVSFEPADLYEDSIFFAKLPDNKVLVGYLCHDDAAQDPLESCDGNGDIYSAHRSSRSHAEMQNALGLDSDWEPNLNSICLQTADDRYIEYFVQNTAVEELLADGYVRGSEREQSFISESVDADTAFKISQAEADLLNNYPWDVRYPEEYEDIKKQMWSEGRANGTIGSPYAISLDVYDHGGQVYSISGTGTQCQWDTARGGAVWVPDECCLDHIMTQPESERKAMAYKCCESALVEFNAWLSGDTYGVCISTCDAITGEELESEEYWGFYTAKYALEEVKNMIEYSTKKEST